MSRLLRCLVGLILASSAAACELEEVSAPKSDDLLVVDAVLRAGARVQHFVLHRSVEGRVVRGEPGAQVSVIEPDGNRVAFHEFPGRICIQGRRMAAVRDVELEASCYVSPLGFEIRPGLAYQLEVETTRGERIRGRTVVPGMFTYVSPRVALGSSNLVAGCRLPSVPFTLAWRPSAGAWAYIVTLEMRGWADPELELPDPLELTSVSVSSADTTLLFPANVGLFQRGDVDSRVFDILRQGLPARGSSDLVVMAIDRNYTNAIRGGRFNPSGNVRLSSVAGDGVGVFGSVVPITIRSGGEGAAEAPCSGVLPPERG